MADDYFQCADINLHFMLSIQRMEVRWCMFSPEHLDDDTEKLTDGWHDGLLKRARLECLGSTAQAAEKGLFAIGNLAQFVRQCSGGERFAVADHAGR
jgi:hypothetical protein